LNLKNLNIWILLRLFHKSTRIWRSASFHSIWTAMRYCYKYWEGWYLNILNLKFMIRRLYSASFKNTRVSCSSRIEWKHEWWNHISTIFKAQFTMLLSHLLASWKWSTIQSWRGY
jgi:hypothetical protein